jgi:trigger factor
MTASIETLRGLERCINIHIPAAEVEKAYQLRLQKIAKEAKIPGFRPGKVPSHILETRFGKGIFEETASELMQTQFQHAVEEHHLQVAGMPQVEVKKALKKGESLEFAVHFQVYPEVKLNSLAGDSVERTKVNISEADIDKMLTNVAQQHAEWHGVERAAKIGDRAVIDFEGTIDGKPFERGEAKDFTLELGSKRMIAGFEDGVVGAKANDVRDINITFPDDYPSEDVAGKAAVFKVTVHKVSEPKLPALDDAFAEKIGITGGIAGLREEVRKSMATECDNIIKNQVKMRVLDKLVAKNPIDVPDALIEVEINHLQQMTRNRVAMQTRNEQEAQKMQLPRDPYVEQAKKRVILGLLLGEYIKQHKIEVDQDLVRKRVEEMAASYPQPQEVISWYYNNKKMLAEIEAVVLEDQAVNKLLTELTVEDKPVSYEEVVKQQTAAE